MATAKKKEVLHAALVMNAPGSWPAHKARDVAKWLRRQAYLLDRQALVRNTALTDEGSYTARRWYSA